MGTMRINLRRSVSAAAIAMGLSFAAGVGMVVMVATPAVAQTTLSAAQIAAIQTSLRAALNAAQTDAAREQAIASIIESAIATYGPDAAAAITSAVMDTAEGAGVAAAVIGRGVAMASAAEATSNNMAAANAIATTIANEGNAGERSSYQAMSTSLGQTALASIAGAGPTVTGGTTGGQGGIGLGGTGGTAGGSSPGGGGGGCLNPSCSHV